MGLALIALVAVIGFMVAKSAHVVTSPQSWATPDIDLTPGNAYELQFWAGEGFGPSDIATVLSAELGPGAIGDMPQRTGEKRPIAGAGSPNAEKWMVNIEWNGDEWKLKGNRSPEVLSLADDAQAIADGGAAPHGYLLFSSVAKR